MVDNYSERVGEVVMVTVKRVDRGNVYVDMGGIDGMISKYDLIPNESIRKNDRLRALRRSFFLIDSLGIRSYFEIMPSIPPMST